MSVGRSSWTSGVLAALVLVAIGCGDGADDSDRESTTSVTAVDETEVGIAELENPYAGYRSDVYADDAVWHCRPDLADDICDGELSATSVAADGSLSEIRLDPALDPGFDCFYVYPTLDYSQEPGNRSFDEPNPLEAVTIEFQAAWFGSLCDLYVPRYRQATIGSYDEARVGDLHDAEPFAVAYDDVADSFRHYMAAWNEGRPVVLLGHSQGSHHLIKLLQEEFDEATAMRGQLISALLVGPTGRVRVPEGEVVGGSFANLPLCTAADEVGCVIAFDSYAATEPPQRQSEADDGNSPACVNPTELVDGDGRLEASFFGRTVEGVTTATEVIEDYYTADCVLNEGGFLHLSIDADPEPGDSRALGHIDARTADSESLHVADYNFALGDLLSIVESQAAAYGVG